MQFAYTRHADQDRVETRHKVIIVGAGPVGLTLALDLAKRGVASVLLDDSDRIGEGSRAICFAKRTLEIFDRLGAATPLLQKGVTWQKGRVFLQEKEVYAFDLQPEGGHKMPAFINIQQYYVEQVLVEAVLREPLISLRWRNKVVGVAGETLEIETPDGRYMLRADYIVACDGAKSAVRGLLNLPFVGEVFSDNFLIADVKMLADYPTERWFWFDPPFHKGQSALLHRQPDNIWRIDLQLGREADVAFEKREENILPRLKAMLGEREFSLEWVSIYQFQCRRLEKFIHGNVIFAGDSAHQVSPFGARGANSGIQDADNLGWKLAAVLNGLAPFALLESYNEERVQAAIENIQHSTRSTDFIAPQSEMERVFRNTVLKLAPKAEFAKKMVNSGRLSTPTQHHSPQDTPDEDEWEGAAQLGLPALDCPFEGGWLLNALGKDFTLVRFGHGEADILVNDNPVFARRYDASAGAAFLFRPDGQLCARWRYPTLVKIQTAKERALCCN